MIIYVDIDNTICTTNGNDYINSEPIIENINKINKLYDEGHTIVYWTARGARTGYNHHELTLIQLKSWNCKYHNIISGQKPVFDMLIDDKAIKIDEL